MLQEAIDLQRRAVDDLIRMLDIRKEITFRAPTGSGKTYMMSDIMDRIIAKNSNIIFLVSTLSKGNLAQQNYNAFCDYTDRGIFPRLRPYLINTDLACEERLHIPDGYNVYVLPRDLYKKGGRLMQGAMQEFLFNTVMTDHHEIYLVKDECHQATNNLDDLSAGFFAKIFNFSATPNLRRGQTPDVIITDEEAERANLIKHIEMGDDNETVEDALKKFEVIREQYRNLLGVNPCLIIQISNKDKAEEEWATIKQALDNHQTLKWMTIMDQERMCDSNDKVRQLPVHRWKDYAREQHSAIDVIIFKMVISEGWDIPRACMLYQVRDTKSRQLDEQVVGRVRRNPRLADFERLPVDAQQLAMTAWVWGVLPESIRRTRQVKLIANVPSSLKVKTTRLKDLSVRRSIDIDALLASKPALVTHTNIFELYRRFMRCEQEVRDLCYAYAGADPQRWFLCCEHIDTLRREYDSRICDYDESMEVGNTVSLPLTSVYTDYNYVEIISNWVWQRRDKDDRFAFDSEAEKEWATRLKDMAHTVAAQNGHETLDDSPDCYLWGKNYPSGSDIRFEYYSGGVHSSYPDFVLKDRKGRIHLFEVKSVNVSNSEHIDSNEYKTKIITLKECYRHCSRLTDQLFYLPVLSGGTWQIYRFVGGKEDTITLNQLQQSLI